MTLNMQPMMAADDWSADVRGFIAGGRLKSNTVYIGSCIAIYPEIVNLDTFCKSSLSERLVQEA